MGGGTSVPMSVFGVGEIVFVVYASDEILQS